MGKNECSSKLNLTWKPLFKEKNINSETTGFKPSAFPASVILSNQLHSVSVAMETPIHSVPSGFLRRTISRPAGDLVDLRLTFSGDCAGVLQNK